MRTHTLFEYVSNSRAQRVHVIGPHLLDSSLPYDLWTHEAELAAIVYVVMQRPDLDAKGWRRTHLSPERRANR